MDFIFISYTLLGILYFILFIRNLCDCNSILESSKSREMKNLAKSEITRTRNDIVLCLVWPYLLYRDISLARRALQSLK